MRHSTYPLVWVREILRAAVEGFKVKGFLFVKGYHLGKWSSMVLTEHLTLSVIEIRLLKVNSLALYSVTLMIYMPNIFIYPYPNPSSVGDFQRRVIGKGTTSVMENSRTLKAGDKIAHYTQKISTQTHTQ